MVIPLPLVEEIALNPLFQGLGLVVLRSLLAQSRLLVLPKHCHLLNPSDPPHSLLIILRGWIKLFLINEVGMEISTGLFGPQDIVLGEFLFPIGIQNRLVGASMATSGVVVEIPLKLLRQHVALSEILSVNLLRLMAINIHNMSRHIELLKAHTATERVEKMLLHIMLTLHHQPVTCFELPLSHTELAQYLGLSRETFSRSLCKLRASGVHIEHHHVTLEKLETLCKVCDMHLSAACCHHRKQPEAGHSACPNALSDGRLE